MKFNEFVDFCNQRVEDGRWSADNAMMCLDIISAINEIKIPTIRFWARKFAMNKRILLWRRLEPLAIQYVQSWENKYEKAE